MLLMSDSTKFRGELIISPHLSTSTLSHCQLTSPESKTDTWVYISAFLIPGTQSLTNLVSFISCTSLESSLSWPCPSALAQLRPRSHSPVQQPLSGFPASILAASTSQPSPTLAASGRDFLKHRSDPVAHLLCNFLWLPCGLRSRLLSLVSKAFYHLPLPFTSPGSSLIPLCFKLMFH